MASIRQAAQDVLAEAKEEIAWIALWRDCRGWMTIPFWPEDVNDTEPTFNAEDKMRTRFHDQNQVFSGHSQKIRDE